MQGFQSCARPKLPLIAVKDDEALQFGAERLAQCAEGLELVPIPRDEPAPSMLDLGQSTKAVILDLEQPVLMGERF